MYLSKTMFFKIFAIFLSMILIICNTPYYVYATEQANAFVVNGTGDYTYQDGVLKIQSGEITVSNMNVNEPTSDRIEINGTSHVTLAGVNIETTNGAPITIKEESGIAVTLMLKKENTLVSKSADNAAIHKSSGQSGGNNTSTLVIDGNGSLTAIGGSNAAGIGGGGYRGDVANITIRGGNISAISNSRYTAAIGASNEGSVWNLIIEGGNISANGSPGIGPSSASVNGQKKEVKITGGIVTTNSYISGYSDSISNSLVSTDGGKNYEVYGNYELTDDFTLPSDSNIFIKNGNTLDIPEDHTLTLKGTMYNSGTLSGYLDNQGEIYTNNPISQNITGLIHYKPYFKVINGNAEGDCNVGSTVTVSPTDDSETKAFKNWTLLMGDIGEQDLTQKNLTFTIPDSCVILQANYFTPTVSLTTVNQEVKYYEDFYDALFDWEQEGGTLTLLSDEIKHIPFEMMPNNGILDLGGHEIICDWIYIHSSMTIRNGRIKINERGMFNIHDKTNFCLNNVELDISQGEFDNAGNMVIDSQSKIIVEEMGVFSNSNVINNDGSILINIGGTYTGTQPNTNVVQYQIGWDNDGNGTIDENKYLSYGETPLHEDGKKQSDNQYYYEFIGWDHSFDIVTEPKVYTAKFKEKLRYYQVELPTGKGYSIVTNDKTSKAYGEVFTFSIDLLDGYTKTDDFKVYANDKVIAPNNDGEYVVEITGATKIMINGIVDLSAPIISGIENGKTYYTTQKVTVSDNHLYQVKVNGKAVQSSFNLNGNQEKTYVIEATDVFGNITSMTVYMKPINSLEDILGGITNDTVTSNDIDVVKDYLNQLENQLKNGNLSEEEKKVLENLKAEAEKIIDRIEEVNDTTNFKYVNKVENLTLSNVVLGDKNDLLQAKSELEFALKEYVSNYTDEQVKQLKEKLNNINKLLNFIITIENLEKQINSLPDNIEIDDINIISKVESIQAVYNQMNDYGKSLVSKNAINKLNAILKQLTNYQVIEGNNSKWIKGSGQSLIMTFNGAYEKFVYIMIDGQLVDEKYYTVASGSTIITLNADYLNTLTVGQHTLTVNYQDGKVNSYFTIINNHKKIPNTDDYSYVKFWYSSFIVAGCILIYFITSKKKKHN